MEDIVKIIGDVGFPISITLYVLIRLESKMSNLSDSIINLTSAIEKNLKN